jgi:hypothetical protein
MFAMTIATNLGLLRRFQIHETVFTRFLLGIKAWHRDLVHNWKRAVKGAHFVYNLIKMAELGSVLSQLEQLVLIVAVLCRDIDWQAELNESFVDESLSIVFRDRPAMEIHHCERTIEVINSEGSNIFENVPDGDLDDVWAAILALIQTTNMGDHFGILLQFRNLAWPHVLFNERSPSHRLLLMKILIKLADVFWVFLDWTSCVEWTERVVGKCESQEQLGFIWFVARPLMGAVAEVFPKAKMFLDTSDKNRAEWVADARSNRR